MSVYIMFMGKGSYVRRSVAAGTGARRVAWKRDGERNARRMYEACIATG